jgi:hypothetical protein
MGIYGQSDEVDHYILAKSRFAPGLELFEVCISYAVRK